jgi:hypothetical protein
MTTFRRREFLGTSLGGLAAAMSFGPSFFAQEQKPLPRAGKRGSRRA